MTEIRNKIIQGDCLTILKTLPTESVDCCITSPPYCGETQTFINKVVEIVFMRREQGRFVKGEHYSIPTEFKKGEHWRPYQIFRNTDYLMQEYVTKMRSAKEIAIEHNITENAILFWLKKNQIKTRTMSHIRNLKYWGSCGQDNPMWNKKGELNPNWKGGITAERQAFYSSIEWKIVSKFVWTRDDNTCQRCKIKFDEGLPFHIHHVVPFGNKKFRADPNALILVCEICHNWIHSKKNFTSQFISAGGDAHDRGTLEK